MNNEHPSTATVEEEQEVIPEGFVKTRRGQVIAREKACFALREAALKTGEKVLVGDRAIYRNIGKGQLVRLDKQKLSKADKKAAKRLKVKTLKSAPVVALDTANDDPGRPTPPHRSGGGHFPG